MDERVYQFRVGVMVLTTLIIAAILVLLFGELPAYFKGRYPIYIHFPDATGVGEDTPIRASGILIGRVSNIRFADQEGTEGVIITAGIDQDITLYENQVCRLSTSLLGDAELQFVQSKDPHLTKTPLKPGTLLAGVTASDPLSVISNLEGDLSGAIRSIADTSDQVGRLAGQVNSLLEANSDQFTRIVSKAETSLDTINTLVSGMNELVDDPQRKERLKQAIDDLPVLLSDMHNAVDGFKVTIDSADRNLKNLEGFTRPLGERGDELIAKVDRGFERLDVLLAEFAELGKALNNPNGSLGQLLNKPDLYQHINQAAENIDYLTREMRPILRDVRVFTDKIARHPGELGVRGALHPSSGLK